MKTYELIGQDVEKTRITIGNSATSYEFFHGGRSKLPSRRRAVAAYILPALNKILLLH
jgi:hypothetical protein